MVFVKRVFICKAIGHLHFGDKYHQVLICMCVSACLYVSIQLARVTPCQHVGDVV